MDGRLGLIAIGAWLSERPLLSDEYDPILYNFLLGLGVGFLTVAAGCQADALRRRRLAGLHLMMQFDDPQGMTRFMLWGLPGAVLLCAFIAMETLFAGNRAIKALGDWSTRPTCCMSSCCGRHSMS